MKEVLELVDKIINKVESFNFEGKDSDLVTLVAIKQKIEKKEYSIADMFVLRRINKTYSKYQMLYDFCEFFSKEYKRFNDCWVSNEVEVLVHGSDEYFDKIKKEHGLTHEQLIQKYLKK